MKTVRIRSYRCPACDEKVRNETRFIDSEGYVWHEQCVNDTLCDTRATWALELLDRATDEVREPRKNVNLIARVRLFLAAIPA